MGVEGRNRSTEDIEKDKDRFGHFVRAEFGVDVVKLFVLAGGDVLLTRMGNNKVRSIFLAREVAFELLRNAERTTALPVPSTGSGI